MTTESVDENALGARADCTCPRRQTGYTTHMEAMRTRVPVDRYQRQYLQDHWIASCGLASLFERSTRLFGDPEARTELADLASGVREDQAALQGILRDFDVPLAPIRTRLVSVAESVGRLKLNGSLFRRSPLSDLEELEALGAGVHAMKMGWLGLLKWTDVDNRLNPYQLELLVKRAEDHEARLDELRSTAAARLADQRHVA
jgi:hypothetical protein